MVEHDADEDDTLRRTVLKAMGAVGGAGALAGCSSGDGATSVGGGTTDAGTTTATGGGGDGPDANLGDGVTTVAGLHSAMADDELTAEELTQYYLDRIDAYDGELNAYLHINEDALDRASELDQTLEESGPVGPLHGIPLVLKDNFDTGDMPTTGGSETLEGVVPPDDATTVQRLRDAGAIILGKANMHEFAYGWSTYSSMGGQTPTPYDLSHVSGGSSGGSAAAVAANLAALGTGSDTCGSVRVPPAFTNSVGVRGTLGLISRDGIMPMSERQDIGGPITRTVADAARMLDVMVGYDSADPSTARAVGNVPVGDDPPVTTALGDGDGGSYTDALDEDALEDAGIGIIREYIQQEGERQSVATVVETAIGDMEESGARIVDPVEVPPDDNSLTVTEFHREMDDYLSTLDDPDAPADLEAIVDQPDNVHPAVLPILESSVEVAVEDMDENVEYLQALAARDYYRTMDDADTEPGNRQQILAVMAENDLDALLYPTASAPPAEIPDAEGEYPSQPGDSVNCTLSAGTGLPAVTVPGGFTDEGLPVGIELIGRPFEEETLLGLAYAYEQATGHRRAPEDFGEV